MADCSGTTLIQNNKEIQDMTENKMEKKISRTYFCWAVGGLFGLHHFYLGRDIQAFVWFATFGGGVVGWIRDFWKLPDYVKEANDEKKDEEIVENSRAQLLLREYLAGIHTLCRGKPKATWTLYFGQISLGLMFSSLFRFAIPVYYLAPRIHYLFLFVLLVGLPIAGSMLGVYLASNIGPYQVKFNHCFNENGFSWLFMLQLNYCHLILPFFSTHAANKHLKWFEQTPIQKEKNTYKHLTKRCIIATCCCVLYMALLYAAVEGSTIQTRGGPSVSLIENARDYWLYYCRHGVMRVFDDVMNYFDPSRKYRSYWILGIRSIWMTEGEIKSYCRQLAARWHPDKFLSQLEKESADTKYKAITNACDILKKSKKI